MLIRELKEKIRNLPDNLKIVIRKEEFYNEKKQYCYNFLENIEIGVIFEKGPCQFFGAKQGNYSHGLIKTRDDENDKEWGKIRKEKENIIILTNEPK